MLVYTGKQSHRATPLGETARTGWGPPLLRRTRPTQAGPDAASNTGCYPADNQPNQQN